jgi:hypothetical protein
MVDAIFEFACRFIVIEEICTEHLQSAQPIFVRAKESASAQVATGAHKADASVWKKTQTSLGDRHQTSDQKIDV